MEFTLKENISTESKVDLVGLTIKEAFYEGIVNPMLLEIFFNVNLVLVYSDIEVTTSERLDKLALYDKFISEKVFSNFAQLMEEKYPDDVNMLAEHLTSWAEKYQKYENSFSATLDKLKIFADSMINRTDESISLLESLNPETVEQISSLAETFGIDTSKLSVVTQEKKETD